MGSWYLNLIWKINKSELGKPCFVKYLNWIFLPISLYIYSEYMDTRMYIHRFIQVYTCTCVHI